MTQKLLTISVLVSGRTDTTFRCLDSLQPLMNTIDSELILVDTVCDAKMKKQLETYADKIISFKWCDDFSKARNTIVAAVILVVALGLSGGITFAIGETSITITALACASIAGIVLNLIFPEKDFDPEKAFAADSKTAQINLEKD